MEEGGLGGREGSEEGGEVRGEMKEEGVRKRKNQPSEGDRRG